MIKKREACLYCGGKMESKTAKKKFCSDKCKVYWHRENHTEMKIIDANKQTQEIKSITHEPPKTNYTINTVSNKEGMPKGLSLAEQIEWRMNNKI